ncbi:hypothetical protein DRJ19_02140 [Candidatus Woesearchaeota archaeon]|nr:MAG: hypothetical protein DRJ19_02140 [Candidatus Woesearchaeota archaeon]
MKLTKEIIEIMDELTKYKTPIKRLPLLKKLKPLADEFIAKDERCKAIRLYAHRIEGLLDKALGKRYASIQGYLEDLAKEINKLCAVILGKEKWKTITDVMVHSDQGSYHLKCYYPLLSIEENFFSFDEELQDDIIQLAKFLSRIRKKYKETARYKGNFEIFAYKYCSDQMQYYWAKCDTLVIHYAYPKNPDFYAPVACHFPVNLMKNNITGGILSLIKCLDDVREVYKKVYNNLKSIITNNEKALNEIRKLATPYILANL